MHPAVAADRSERIANYSIDARLDPLAKTVSGRERLRWRNTAAESAPDLYFHLYLNAFANNHSTFMREYLQSAGADALKDWQDGWGSIEIESVRVGGRDIVSELHPAHPDDSNPDDRTVVRLTLPAPVPPGQEVEVEIDFVAHLPKLLERSGYAGSFFFVAQWFPKVGVYSDGHWNCHQYHATTEFFADFGVYDVGLTVPTAYVVGATGVRSDERDNGDGTRTVRYRAEDVHDFAWTADPAFREIHDQFDDVQLTLLCHPRDCGHADRHLAGVKHGLTWFRDHIGRYPYPTLTIVDPGRFGAAAGGMEYPTLITGAASRWVPRSVRLPEWVALHEFGHQYWYGLVANNEFEEAWLDEGVNSYTEGKALEAAYGPVGNLIDIFGLRIDDVMAHRAAVMSRGGPDPIMRRGWEFLDPRSYRTATYAKTALALRSLEGYLGEERLLAGLRVYYDRWRYRHPSGEDFFAVLSEAAGENLDWFVDETFRDHGAVDYAVTRVEVEPVAPFAGIQLGGDDAQPVDAADTYHSTVVVERLGDARLPVEVAVFFDESTEMHEQWDGRARWRRFEYTGTSRVSRAVVDPQQHLPLDVDPINNSRMSNRATRGLVRLGVRWGFWFQNLLHMLTGF